VNGETFLWVLVYAVVGLVVLALAAAIIVGAMRSARQVDGYAVHLQVDDHVSVIAKVTTEGAAREVVNTWAPDVMKPGRLR